MKPGSSAPTLFLLVMVSALVLQFFLPWWIVVVTGFGAGYISNLKPWKTSAIVFLAIGLLWLLFALYLSVLHSTVLLPRVSGLFQLPSKWMLFPVTFLVGALPASVAALGVSHIKHSLSAGRLTNRQL